MELMVVSAVVSGEGGVVGGLGLDGDRRDIQFRIQKMLSALA